MDEAPRDFRETVAYEQVLVWRINEAIRRGQDASTPWGIEAFVAAVEALYYALPQDLREMVDKRIGNPKPLLQRTIYVTQSGVAALSPDEAPRLRDNAQMLLTAIVDVLKSVGLILTEWIVEKGYEEVE